MMTSGRFDLGDRVAFQGKDNVVIGTVIEIAFPGEVLAGDGGQTVVVPKAFVWDEMNNTGEWVEQSRLARVLKRKRA